MAAKESAVKERWQQQSFNRHKVSKFTGKGLPPQMPPPLPRLPDEERGRSTDFEVRPAIQPNIEYKKWMEDAH